VIALGAMMLAAAGCAEPTVVRVFDGHEVEGRFIDERAYALYARAATAEAEGNRGAALQMFEAASVEDPASAEIWARIGALRCDLRDPRADEAFDRALARDREYEPAWRGKAACALSRGDLSAAAAAADKALLLDPERVATAVLHATVAERQADAVRARRELEALVLRAPSSLEAWRALHDLGARQHDAALVERSTRAIRDLYPSLASSRDVTSGATDAPPLRLAESAPTGESVLVAIDADLARGDLASARRRAIHARVTASEIALRAAALGRAKEAREQAELVAGADPSDASAIIALAVAADLADDQVALDRAARALEATRGAQPSYLARLLYAELLARRASREAARLWLTTQSQDSHDALTTRVEARLRERLSDTASAPRN
jgi:tetratricopeptide (TPR) repeat protein